MIDSSEIFKDKKIAELADAVQSGNIKKIKALVKEGINPNSVGEKDTSLLFWAIMVDSPEGFEALLETGADATIFDSEGRTMLHIAAMAGSSKFLQILLKRGVDPNIKSNISKDTAIYDVSGENSSGFNLLINAGTDINLKNNVGETILHNSALSGTRTDYLIQLLKAGADPMIRNKRGDTFQGYFFMTPENILTEEGKEKRQWVKNWLNEHSIQLEEK